jgi:cell division protein ZapA
MSGPQDVTVTIHGQSYTLRSDADPAAVTALAAEVDARMREAAGAGVATGADRLAVLVALNLADDLARERRAREAEQKDVGARARQLLDVLAEEVGNGDADGVSS